MTIDIRPCTAQLPKMVDEESGAARFPGSRAADTVGGREWKM